MGIEVACTLFTGRSLQKKRLKKCSPFRWFLLWYLLPKLELNFEVKLDLDIGRWKLFNFVFSDMGNNVSSTWWL